jgi:signal transduction histidine kinase
MKIGYKLTLFYTLLSGVILAIVSISYYFHINHTLYSVADDQLRYIVKKVTDNFVNSNNVFETFHIEEDLIDDDWILMLSPDKKVVFASASALRFPIDANVQVTKTSLFNYTFNSSSTNAYYLFWPVDKKVNYRFLAGNFRMRDNQYYNIIVGIPINHIISTIKQLKYSIIVGFIIFISLFSFAGYAFSRYSLQPILKITESINKIAGHNLSSRINMPDNGDEIGRLSAAINDLFNRLEKSFQMQRQFISDVSHELKTPLAIVKLSLDNLLNSREFPADTENSLLSVLETTRSMDMLIKKLLLLSRLEEMQNPLLFETFDLNESLNTIYEDLLPLAENKFLKFSIDLPESPLSISGDRKLLSIAFFNVIENAVKYTSTGGISIRLERTDKWIRLQVKDSGIGISKTDTPKVFERFFRADESRNLSEGFGVGLSITRKIIELHYGRIELISSLGIGTECLVCLPADQPIQDHRSKDSPKNG